MPGNLRRFIAEDLVTGAPWAWQPDDIFGRVPGTWLDYGLWLESLPHAFTLEHGGRIVAIFGLFEQFAWAVLAKTLSLGDTRALIRSLRGLLATADSSPRMEILTLVDRKYLSGILLLERLGFTPVDAPGPMKVMSRNG